MDGEVQFLYENNGYLEIDLTSHLGKNEDIVINDIEVKRQELNFVSIYNYYLDKEKKNPHLIISTSL